MSVQNKKPIAKLRVQGFGLAERRVTTFAQGEKAVERIIKN